MRETGKGEKQQEERRQEIERILGAILSCSALLFYWGYLEI